MPLLRISALHKYYGDHHVLKGIDLTVDEGQVVAIIGRSGSGKSTLLRTLNGLESINDGVIEVDGEYLDAAYRVHRIVFVKANVHAVKLLGALQAVSKFVVIVRGKRRKSASGCRSGGGSGNRFRSWSRRSGCR